MTPLQRTLLLCAVQVTLLALVACAIHIALRKRSPAVRSSLTLHSLYAIFVVSLLAFSPWPNWTGSLWNQSAPPQAAESAAIETGEAAAAHESAPAATELKVAAPDSTWAAAWEGFRTAMTSPEAAPTASSRWNSVPTILAALFACGLIVGGARLIGGWIAVARLRNLSRPLNESALGELIDILQAEAGCGTRIEIRESLRLSTAATIGWRKPIILLPTAWRDWTPTEMRAVLAHEIAHIHHRDYAAWLLAQASVVLHFYHPLVHWLAARLRLDQELAADAAAAQFAGGRQSYLETLAQLALRQADRPVSWPVRAFLPTHQTFLRRLQMLRDPGQFSNRSPGRMRWAGLAAMMAAGLLVSGLRGPGEGSRVTAADTPTLTLSESPAPLSLAYVPRDAVAVVGFRPSRAIQMPATKPLVDALIEDGSLEKTLGLKLDQIESVTLIALTGGEPNGPPVPQEAAFVIQTRAAGQAKTLADTASEGGVTQTFDGQTIQVSTDRALFAVVGDRTVLFSRSESALRRVIVAGSAGRPSSTISSAWAQVSSDDVGAVVNVATIGAELTKQPLPPQAAVFAPLWQKLQTAAFGVKLGNLALIHASGQAGSAADAKQVKDTLGALIVLARNGLSGFRASAGRLPAEQSAMVLRTIDLADELFDKVQIEQKEDQISLKAELDGQQTSQIIASLAPKVIEARKAARRTQDFNNLKQIMLALHNYQDVYGHFPAAAVLGPDGKTYHSWRVAILPFVDQAPLYNEYHLNEPWDSQHNRALIAKMPAVFRSPVDPETSTNASYFAVTGNGTMWSNPQGCKISEITDGTSNTIAVVEAQRDIPWTKPEDIPYDPAKPLPEFGGRYDDGFLVGLADGSVRTIFKTASADLIRLLLTIQDGTPLPAF